MSTEGIATFRAAVQAYEDSVRDRIGATYYAESAAAERRRLGGKLRNELLADALDGLDLTTHEWHLMKWFLSWDEQDTLAAIITKARVTSPGLGVGRECLTTPQ